MRQAAKHLLRPPPCVHRNVGARVQPCCVRKVATAGIVARDTEAVVVEQFGGPEVMVLKRKQLPDLSPRQILLAVKAAGVNPSDTYVRLGPQGPYAGKPELLPTLPYTPGKDAAGVVEAVGAQVEHVQVGDRVYTTGSVTGTLAAHAVCGAEQIHPLPAPVSFEQGACVGVPCATAYYALHVRARIAAGERILIHGASGAVGLAAVQLAKAAGASVVVGTAGTPAGEEAVRAAGADVAVNHRAKDYVEAVRSAVPANFDVILEMSAHANLPADLSLLARRGRLCIIGSRAQDVPVNPRLFMGCEADVRGVFLPGATPEELAAVHSGLGKVMSAGLLAPVVGMTLPLAEAAVAHREVMEPSRGGAVGNVVLVP